MSTVTTLVHNRVQLALHTLRDGEGRSLLLLHGLGESSPSTVPSWAEAWPGPIHALDFTGHGDSTVPAGGGYSAEILLADADVALAHLGEVTVVGRGLGAYVALMLAGARPKEVRGAVLCDGPGMHGGATGPSSSTAFALPDTPEVPDPYVLVEMSRDMRPRDYAAIFARLAIDHSGLDEPISVAAMVRPGWIDGAIEAGAVERSVDEALAEYARA